MDEPLSNLDAKLRVQMRAELKRFHQELHATVLYVTHDQLEAVTMADKIAVMNGGVLQQYDSPDEIFDRPGQHLRRRLHRQPGDEPAPAGGGRAPTARTAIRGEGGWELPLCRRCARGRRAHEQRRGGPRRAPQPDPAPSARPPRARWRPASTPSSRPATSPTSTSGSATQLIVASADADFRADPDDPIWVEFDQEHLHLFDAATTGWRCGGVIIREDHRRSSATRSGSASATSSSSRSRPTRASTAGASPASPGASRRSSAPSSTSGSS